MREVLTEIGLGPGLATGRLPGEALPPKILDNSHVQEIQFRTPLYHIMAVQRQGLLMNRPQVWPPV